MIQVYTGKGKGKTTAALGLALRAAGSGLHVYIAQFCKGKNCGELNSLKKIPNIRVERFGSRSFIRNAPRQEDIDLARKGLIKVKQAIAGKKFDIIILDEINVAVKLGILDPTELKQLIKCLPKDTELILTGRDAPEWVCELADLISEVKEVKHYYKKGIMARKGIEF